jgi:hypothetical protein
MSSRPSEINGFLLDLVFQRLVAPAIARGPTRAFRAPGFGSRREDLHRLGQPLSGFAALIETQAIANEVSSAYRPRGYRQDGHPALLMQVDGVQRATVAQASLASGTALKLRWD